MEHDEFIPTCAACQDTGWYYVECDGHTAIGQAKLCGRPRVHHAHQFVRPCGCRPMNRSYQQRRQGLSL